MKDGRGRRGEDRGRERKREEKKGIRGRGRGKERVTVLRWGAECEGFLFLDKRGSM